MKTMTEKAPVAMDWTETRQGLIAAGVSAAALPLFWQLGINLRGADLTWANLRRANLREADLRGADLRKADLREADLTGADLNWADLRGADLRGADLHEASGPFATGSFGRHHAIAAGGYISIGCERHTYAEWLKRYEEIGREHDYSAAEIEVYGAWIRAAVTWLEPVEAEIAAAFVAWAVEHIR